MAPFGGHAQSDTLVPVQKPAKDLARVWDLYNEGVYAYRKIPGTVEVYKVGSELSGTMANWKDSLLASENGAEADKAIQQRVDQLLQLKDKAQFIEAQLRNSAAHFENILKDSVFVTGHVNDTVERQTLSGLRAQALDMERLCKARADSLFQLSQNIDKEAQEARALLSGAHEAGGLDTQKDARGAKFIWAAKNKFDQKDLIASFKKNQNFDVKKYLLDSEWGERMFLLLISFGFAYWAYTNLKKLGGLPSDDGTVPPVVLTRRFWPIALAAGLVFFFTLLPFFESALPSLLLQCVQLFGLLSLAFYVNRAKGKGSSYKWYLGFALFFFLFLTINNFISSGFVIRVIVLGVNIAALFLVLKYKKRLQESGLLKRWTKYLLYLFSILNVLGLVFNIWGKVDAARICNIAGLAGIAYYAQLAGFIEVVNDAMALQFRYSEQRNGFFSRLNKEKTLGLLNKLLYLISIYLWVFVLSMHAGFIDVLSKTLSVFLNKKHQLGSIPFTWGNVLMCTVILLIANWLQKHLPLFFSDAPTMVYGSQGNEKRSTKMALVRLIIVVVSFFLAISALGLSMDKLTVILGALTVGIGLGLQNIFNNFVSGIILIFEKPFRVGDYIELADKKGKVKDIGIRSSTLLTQDGAELIIPNGDLLSGRLVNWTLTTGQSKCTLKIQVAQPENIGRLKEIIKDELSHIRYVVKNMPQEILYNSFAAGTVELAVSCWIASVYNESKFKSELLERLFERCRKEEIAINGS